jgi:hypothetical protein
MDMKEFINQKEETPKPVPVFDSSLFIHRDEVSDMITSALREHDRKKREITIPAEVQEFVEEAERWLPIVEALTPTLVQKVSPALKTLIISLEREFWPLQAEMIRKEVRVIAKELFAEYFRQLKLNP